MHPGIRAAKRLTGRAKTVSLVYMDQKNTSRGRTLLNPVSLLRRSGGSLNLSAALILYVLLPMGIVVAVLTVANLRLMERQAEKRMQHELEIVAKAIEQPLRHAFRRDREGSIQRALESAFSMSHVYGAYLYDPAGKKIFDSSPGEAKEDQIEISERISEGIEYGEYERFAGRNVYSYFVPLTDSGGRIAGLLQLTRRRSDFQEHIRSIRYKVGGGVLIGFVFLTALVLRGHHRVFGIHLRRLIGCMGRIAGGDRQERFVPGGPREIVLLGEHFNGMLDTLARIEEENRQREIQRKAMAERLRQAEKLAAVGELAAGVAHELGTPLSLIDAKTQRVLRIRDLPEKLQQALGDIRGEVRRMERIIRQLLDFSRCSPVRRSRMDAAEPLHASVHAVAHEAQSAGTQIIVGDVASGLRLHADPARIEQALVNLLRNAVQAAPGGDAVLRLEEENGGAVYSVEDTGPGIPAEQRRKIFEPFYTTKAVGEGTGLGLAVVHGIAEEHGGRVELAAAKGRGACFRLYIPDAIATQPSDAAGKTDPEEDANRGVQCD
jgi:two-component system, NtrC family, sensor kinase